MDAKQRINDWISSEVDLRGITIQNYPSLPYGHRLVDKKGDYILVCIDTKRNIVIYTIKGMEGVFFPGEEEQYF
ncbi:hypothetical protein [Pseudalkalibacillus caeni]|uniref:Uncharacterized protein n=1 Tax=Exobacillus caeni TaxID=2574798 RepID=A0A5R9F8K7_9BACL|nr:hypothetical protein [Pseudalkalibacillus caeni]TLS36854.1 hypothetical protein FCL54_12930 [Pseudalkalibacillus caeni]